jgi:hypothetical protein
MEPESGQGFDDAPRRAVSRDRLRQRQAGQLICETSSDST